MLKENGNYPVHIGQRQLLQLGPRPKEKANPLKPLKHRPLLLSPLLPRTFVLRLRRQLSISRNRNRDWQCPRKFDASLSRMAISVFSIMQAGYWRALAEWILAPASAALWHFMGMQRWQEFRCRTVFSWKNCALRCGTSPMYWSFPRFRRARVKVRSTAILPCNRKQKILRSPRA